MVMDIIYVAVWAIIACFCFFSAHKVHNILYFAGVFFTFMFGWNLADLLLETDLHAGVAGWIYKGVALSALIAFALFYLKIRNNTDKS